MSITVDFQHYAAGHTGENPAAALLAWLRNSPDRSSIHVFLRYPPMHDGSARQFQYALQSLGCTVTRRMPVANAA